MKAGKIHDAVVYSGLPDAVARGRFTERMESGLRFLLDRRSRRVVDAPVDGRDGGGSKSGELGATIRGGWESSPARVGAEGCRSLVASVGRYDLEA